MRLREPSVSVRLRDGTASERLLGQLTADKPAMGSVTPTEVRVTLPELVTL